jgi:hypothetical protein
MHRPVRMAVAAFALAVAASAVSPGPARALAQADDAGTGAYGPEAPAADAATEASGPEPPVADAQPVVEAPSGPAGQIADWVIATGDNGGRPFVIVDKVAADVFVFSADGRLQGEAPALVGFARGDDSAPGVGDLALSAIRPDERTTPAGRFVMHFGAATEHRTVLWVDYADSISLHPVITTNPSEHRLERIRSAAAEDHRITYGCINVPSRFYTDVVVKALAGGIGVAYILPDTKPLEEVFPGFTVVRGTTSDGSGAAGDQALEQARSFDGPSNPNSATDDTSGGRAPRSGASMSDPTSDPGEDAAAVHSSAVRWRADPSLMTAKGEP